MRAGAAQQLCAPLDRIGIHADQRRVGKPVRIEFADAQHRLAAIVRDRGVGRPLELIRDVVDAHRADPGPPLQIDREHTIIAARELLASIGESHSAFNSANILAARGYTAECIDLSGWHDPVARTIDERINAQVKQQFDSQRALLTAALRDNDAQAIAMLKADPRMPDQLKQLLGNSAVPAAAREQALSASLGQLDTDEQQALADAQTLAGKITRALKLSFTNSITRIYSYAIWLVLGAFLASLARRLSLRMRHVSTCLSALLWQA